MHDNDVHEALNLNCEIHDPFVRCSCSRVGPIWPYSKNVLNLRKSSFLLPYKYIYISGYKVHEALYQNCEIHDLFVMRSSSRVGPIWPCSKNVLNLKKSSSLLPIMWTKN